MQRAQGFLLGLAAGLLALVASAGTADGVVPYLAGLSVLLHALIAPNARLSLGAGLIGGAIGWMLGLRLLPDLGTAFPMALGLILLLASTAWSRQSSGSPVTGHASSEQPWVTSFGAGAHWPALCAALLFLAGREIAASVLVTTGDDLASRTFVAAPILVSAGVGVGLARALRRRHPALEARSAWAITAISLLVVLSLALEPMSGAELYAQADRIQGPSVTRRHFLYGATLLTGSIGGFVTLTTALLLGATVRPQPSRIERVAIAAALLLAPLMPLAPLGGPYDAASEPAGPLDPIRTDMGGPVGAPPPGWPFEASAPPAAIALTVDLGARSFDEVSLLARRALEIFEDPVLVLDGATAHFVGVAGADSTRVSLSPTATRELAERAGNARLERLSLRSARTRISTSRPDLAADNLRRLLRRADRIGPDADGSRRRIDLELAIAILEDDTRAEDHCLWLMERFDARRAAQLRSERRDARAAIHDMLLASRNTDPADADVRHRLGRHYWKSGRIAAGLEELTRAFELRPKLRAAAMDLMEAYLEAESTGYRRWAAGGGRLGNPQTAFAVFGLVRRHGGFDGGLLARAHLALAEIRRIEAGWKNEPELAEGRLHEALGRASAALLDRPNDAGAHRTFARTRLALGLRKGAATRHASDAARLDPLVPEHHLLAAATAATLEERRAAFAAALAAGTPTR